MTDRELLEFAARAVGWKQPRIDEGFCLCDGENFIAYWNPLTDDGDALRLAVEMKLCVDVATGYAVAYAVKLDPCDIKESRERVGDDPCAATRRAIVRAAAEIGKAM